MEIMELVVSNLTLDHKYEDEEGNTVCFLKPHHYISPVGN